MSDESFVGNPGDYDNRKKSPGLLYKEREKRVNAAIELKIPDRIPIIMGFGFFAAKYAGFTCEDVVYNHEKYSVSLKKAVLDYQPDMYFGAAFDPGPVLDILDAKNVKWPGHGIPSDHTHQFVENEYMEADEYDMFLRDPSDYIIRTYLPRIYGSLELFEKFPPLHSLLLGGTIAMASFASPEYIAVLKIFFEAVQEAAVWRSKMMAINKEIRELGFPTFTGSTTVTPFDLISDLFRGMRGSMLDMYRQPDKLIESCEKLLPMMVERTVSIAIRSDNPRVFIPLHRGADGFMSKEQFEIFYWPTFKKLLLALIDARLTPCPFFEGDYTSRLEYLLELPKGKIMGHFDRTDLRHAKQVIGNHICIRGNVPVSLLQTGTSEDVKEYCKQLIDDVGKDGGFIMSARGAIDEAKPENLKALFDITREYGVY